LLAALVWFVWRSPTRYSLKAAILSAAALLASPYAFAYDFAANAIPVAFLASDQMRSGWLKGEQTILLVLFCATLALLAIFRDPPDSIPFGSLPGVGPALLMVLFALTVRRILISSDKSELLLKAPHIFETTCLPDD
jgi:alpha-1,2-mannosyltransferase